MPIADHKKRSSYLGHAFGRLMVLWAMSKNKARGGRRASDDTQRSLSAVWLQVVQEKRAPAHGATESPLPSGEQGLWAAPGQFGHHRRTAGPDRTPPSRENLAPWDLPCGGRRFSVAPAGYGCAVPGAPCASLCQARRRGPDSNPAAAGGQALELWGDERESAGGVGGQGYNYAPSPCLSRRRPQSPQCQSLVGEDSRRVARIRSLLYRPLRRLHGGQSFSPTPCDL